MTRRLVGLASFAQLLQACDISTIPTRHGGFTYRVFIGLPGRVRTYRFRGRTYVFRCRTMMHHIGTFCSTETVWAVYRKLEEMFPNTAWRVSPV